MKWLVSAACPLAETVPIAIKWHRNDFQAGLLDSKVGGEHQQWPASDSLLYFQDAYFAARAAIPAPEHSDSLSSLPAPKVEQT
jgi:hypothetical protein